MTTFLNRRDAAVFLTEAAGRPVSVNALARLAHLGVGPKYGEFLGNACYRREDLLAWLEQELARPTGAPRRRGHYRAQRAAAAS